MTPGSAPWASFPVIGIGGAQTEHEALLQLLEHLAAQTAAAVVITRPAPPLHDRILRAGRFPVCPLLNGTTLAPNRIFLPPPDADIAISGDTIELLSSRSPLSMDLFFRSLARFHSRRAVAVVLGEGASDCVLGLRAVRCRGGFVFANRPSPIADLVLPTPEIAGRLARLEAAWRAPEADLSHPSLTSLFQLLEHDGGLPAERLDHAAVRPQVRRRMALAGADSLGIYQQFLAGNPPEILALCRDLLSCPSDFFPDPALFDSLRTTVFPELLRRRSPGAPLRIWAPGCCTGEEIYSLAMTALEALPESLAAPVRIFATDVCAEDLQTARAGAYPSGIALDVSPERLERFFDRSSGGYQVKPHLRDLCGFAKQDPWIDPPLAGLDLIYCGPALRQAKGVWTERLPRLFQEALNVHGYLAAPDLDLATSFVPWFVPHNPAPGLLLRHPSPQPRGPARGSRFREQIDALLSQHTAGSAVVIDEDLNILLFWGHTAPYLELQPGAARFNVLEMAHQGLLAPLRRALAKARSEAGPVHDRGLLVRAGLGPRPVAIEVLPLDTGPSSNCFLVLFEELGDRTGQPAPQVSKDRQILSLERDLAAAREHMQGIIHHLEAVNEELLVANEGLLSHNEELDAVRQHLLTTNEELVRSNAELSLLCDDLDNLFAGVDIAFVILDVNLCLRRYSSRAARWFRLSSSDLGRPVDLPGPDTAARDVLRHHTPVEYELREPSGRWLSMRLRPYCTSDQEVAGVQVAWIDITALKEAQQALQESEARYRLVSELSAEHAFSLRIEPSGRIVREWTTDVLTRITGFTLREIDEMGWEALVCSADRDAWRGYLQEVLRSGAGGHEYRISTKGGSLRWLRERARAEPTGDGVMRLYGAAQDVTELRESEQLVRHSQKMEAVGRLAGAIAHDFNNLLTAVSGYAELILDSPASPDLVHGYTEEIGRAAGRAAGLTRQLLACSRKQVLQPVVVDLNALLRNLSGMLRRLIGETMDLQLRLADNLGRVRADPAQLDQVVLNLVINARDAMSEGGRLTIRTAGTRIESGPAVVLSITDTGCGMDATTLAHLFEPFFTTKPAGLGTGLGLCTAYGIVRQSGGSITVESEPGRGSTFRVFLPQIDDAVAPAAAAPFHPRTGGKETILLVEDDTAVRSLTASILAGRGYTVLEAADAGQALQFARARPEVLPLLVSDVILPGMSGPDLAMNLRALHSGMKVLFVSGYSGPHLGDLSSHPGAAFLQKPFAPQALLQVVRQLLDAS